MFCAVCGTEMTQSAVFCAACGKPAGMTPLAPAQGRIAGHIRLLGILWLAVSAFRLIPGIILLLVFGAWQFLPPGAPAFVPVLLAVIGGLLSLTAVVGIVTGWGLLAHEPWARMLAIVMACVNLMDLPFGTALGVYTLWVLLPADSEREYRLIEKQAPLVGDRQVLGEK